MKKILIKCFLLVTLVSSYFFIAPVHSILSKSIDFFSVGRFVATSLYEDTKTVSTTPVVVKNYAIVEDRLYVFPLDERVILPVDSMIVEVKQEALEFLALDNRYTLSHYNKTKAHLYEYVYAFNDLSYTNDFYVIA
ncbi:MAG: hypothetical protein K2G50_00960 [Anaeroplasmataceae bacterium]|nr:hypothetical protein [Anaeroplasmataceae bacterium]